MPEEAAAALEDGAAYPHRPARVEHVQTHISHVFIADPYVYKLKKAVRLPFVDASTLARRRRLCEDEVRLNRRWAPDVYLGVLPVLQGKDGRIVVSGDGRVVDHVVWMRRLPEDRMLVRLLADGTVTTDAMVELARIMKRFHDRAASGPAVARHATPSMLRRTWARTVALVQPLVGHGVSPAAVDVLKEFGPWFLNRHANRFAARVASQRIRDGHGDLHAEHVCLVDRPLPALAPHADLAPGIQVFDCLEFSSPLRSIDVASEVAFLAMDLGHRGHPELASAFVEAYVAESADEGLRGVLPWYVAYRACVRAGVATITSGEEEIGAEQRQREMARARGYVTLAVRHAWNADGPIVLACCGRSGTGKSTVAAGLAEHLDGVHLSSDVLRRAAGAGRDEDPYSRESRRRIYETLASRAAEELAAGRSVVADATFLRRGDRERLRDVAATAGRPLLFLECRAAPDTVRRRLAARPPGASDATWETWVGQAGEAEPFGAGERHRSLDTDGALADLHESALRAAWTMRRDAV
jgi:aminoglycoside phosphotransferase family enzyme/predicted kinase